MGDLKSIMLTFGSPSRFCKWGGAFDTRNPYLNPCIVDSKFFLSLCF